MVSNGSGLLIKLSYDLTGLKVVNKWPTFPQFIVNGEFIGGLDVVKDLIENDEFEEAVDLHAK